MLCIVCIYHILATYTKINMYEQALPANQYTVYRQLQISLSLVPVISSPYLVQIKNSWALYKEVRRVQF